MLVWLFKTNMGYRKEVKFKEFLPKMRENIGLRGNWFV